MAETAKVSRPKLAVLDTCVLFHLAEQHAPSHNLVLRLIRRGMTPVVGQTVIQELGYMAANDPSPAKRALATEALKNMRSWGWRSSPLATESVSSCAM